MIGTKEVDSDLEMISKEEDCEVMPYLVMRVQQRLNCLEEIRVQRVTLIP